MKPTWLLWNRYSSDCKLRDCACRREMCLHGPFSCVFRALSRCPRAPPLPDKVHAIQEAPRPRDISKLLSYLRLLSYYSKLIPQLLMVLAPLYQLLQCDRKWHWTQVHTKTFEQSKILLLSSHVLVHFDPCLEMRLTCCASDYGIGVVLSQCMRWAWILYTYDYTITGTHPNMPTQMPSAAYPSQRH